MQMYIRVNFVVQRTRQNCKHFLLLWQKTSFTNLTDGSNSPFVAEIHHPLHQPMIRTRLSLPMSIIMHSELWQGVQHVDGLQAHLILCDRRMMLLLLLTAREFVLTWSLAVFCELTVLPSVTIMWIEPKSQTSPRLTICTDHFLQLC